MEVEVELEQVPINFTGRYQGHNEHQLTDQEDEAHCENEKNKLAELKDQKEKEVTAIKNKISASGLAWDRHADKENNKIVEEVIMGLQFQDLAERNQTNDLKIVEVTKECEAEHQSESFDDGWASIEDQNLENYELEEVQLKEKETKEYETEVEIKLHEVNFKIEGNIPVMPQDFPEIFPPGSADDAVVVYRTRDSLEPCTVDDCDSVVDLLEGYGLKLDVRNTRQSYYEKELLKLLHGCMILPSVFMKGRYIGGLNEVMNLHNSGQLSKILIRATYMEKKKYEKEVELKLHKVNSKIERNILVKLQDFPEIFPPGSADDAVVVYRTRDSLEPCTVDDCDSVVDLLEGYGLKLDVRNTTRSYYEKELLKLLHGFMVLPSVYVKGRYLGGLNEVKKLHNSGQLSNILISTGIYMEKNHNV
ncbi:Glutaredoxin [Quillaja saponaria]|uniref:Glutaredoxin n=1 Tax=Quillaja saponaria TaxID=32244 RepID=A0AAD7Q3E6_QUISA|nr:Glutaredoxin [Quillaja saponaria]